MESLLLGIESSCDESSAAIVRFRKGEAFALELLSDITARQEEVHERFGGIVPELASRRHLESLLPVVRAAISKAGVRYQDLSAIAVTNRPGLLGSLMVGVNAAKSLAYALQIPVVPINHLEAHLGAILLEEPNLPMPLLGLIVSGGHSSLYEISEGWKTFSPLGHTRDDAAGEAFDKGARLLNLPYPGGPAIARLAAQGNPSAYDFPRALPGRDQTDFSFSGLKTALLQFLAKGTQPEAIPDICASYQEAIVDALVNKTVQAVKYYRYKNLVVAGGVAANERLRVKMRDALPEYCRLHVPSPAFCTDNGAMIAALGALRFSQGNCLRAPDFYGLEVSPRTEAKDARGKQR